jgi:catechol 2,3-dioxygenase-like lactoylglutathione lyase family enzyme
MPFDPMLFVDDVEATSRFLQDLLGLRSGHGGAEYEMLLDADGKLALQLHHADAEEHGGPQLPHGAPRGAGVLLYYAVPDVRAAHRKAEAMGAAEGPPTYIRQAGHTEFLTRIPDGYAIAVFQPGEA